MSPRKNNVLIVKGWPNSKKGKLYKGIIRKADNDARHINVVIENLDPSQLGRTHEICSFLLACGIDAGSDGASVEINDVIGVTIGLRFGDVMEDGSQQMEFENIEKSISTSTTNEKSKYKAKD